MAESRARNAWHRCCRRPDNPDVLDLSGDSTSGGGDPLTAAGDGIFASTNVVFCNDTITGFADRSGKIDICSPALNFAGFTIGSVVGGARITETARPGSFITLLDVDAAYPPAADFIM